MSHYYSVGFNIHTDKGLMLFILTSSTYCIVIPFYSADKKIFIASKLS